MPRHCRIAACISLLLTACTAQLPQSGEGGRPVVMMRGPSRPHFGAVPVPSAADTATPTQSRVPEASPDLASPAVKPIGKEEFLFLEGDSKWILALYAPAGEPANERARDLVPRIDRHFGALRVRLLNDRDGDLMIHLATLHSLEEPMWFLGRNGRTRATFVGDLSISDLSRQVSDFLIFYP